MQVLTYRGSDFCAGPGNIPEISREAKSNTFYIFQECDITGSDIKEVNQ